MSAPRFQPGDRVKSPCATAEWATLCAVTHIRETDGGPLVRGWHVRLHGVGTYRWVREEDLRPAEEPQ